MPAARILRQLKILALLILKSFSNKPYLRNEHANQIFLPLLLGRPISFFKQSIACSRIAACASAVLCLPFFKKDFQKKRKAILFITKNCTTLALEMKENRNISCLRMVVRLVILSVGITLHSGFWYRSKFNLNKSRLDNFGAVLFFISMDKLTIVFNLNIELTKTLRGKTKSIKEYANSRNVKRNVFGNQRRTRARN